MDWHRRYLQQASWTRQLRAYLFDRAGISRAGRLLEVGCGTGALLIDVASRAHQCTGPEPRLFGLELQAPPLQIAQQHAPEAILAQGDAHRLPFADHSFDVTFCHFLLLWLSDPLRAVLEMSRVTRTAGHVLALAEPDYSRRVDKPDELHILGRMQEQALRLQGADTSIGSRIAQLFHDAGLTIVETGTIAPRDPADDDEEEWRQEWAVLRDDLAGQLDDAELDRLEHLDRQARRSGHRVLHVPTFFVHAQV